MNSERVERWRKCLERDNWSTAGARCRGMLNGALPLRRGWTIGGECKRSHAVSGRTVRNTTQRCVLCAIENTRKCKQRRAERGKPESRAVACDRLREALEIKRLEACDYGD